MSRIGIIGSFRTSPVNTVLDWFAIVLPIRRIDRRQGATGGEHFQ